MCYQKNFYGTLFGLLFFCIGVNEGAKILYFSTVASRSHALWSNVLVTALAERGHQVNMYILIHYTITTVSYTHLDVYKRQCLCDAGATSHPREGLCHFAR